MWRASVLMSRFACSTVTPSRRRGRVVIMRRPAWVFALQIGGHPQIDVCWETESSRKHADHGVDRVTNFQVRLREILRRSEILAPVSVADQSGGTGALLRGARVEIPPDDRLS